MCFSGVALGYIFQRVAFSEPSSILPPLEGRTSHNNEDNKANHCLSRQFSSKLSDVHATSKTISELILNHARAHIAGGKDQTKHRSKGTDETTTAAAATTTPACTELEGLLVWLFGIGADSNRAVSKGSRCCIEGERGRPLPVCCVYKKNATQFIMVTNRRCDLNL